MKIIPLTFLVFFLFLPVLVHAQALPDPRLLDDPVVSEKPAPQSNEYDDVPYEYLEEAEAIYNECQTDSRLQNYYNCQCLSVKFLDARIEKGAEKSKEILLLSIDGECKDATYLAGRTYNSCITSGSRPPSGKQVDEFCACFANGYAELFEKSKSGPSSRLFVDLQTQARLNCF